MPQRGEHELEREQFVVCWHLNLSATLSTLLMLVFAICLPKCSVMFTDSSYANVVISNNEMSNLNDNQGSHVTVEKPTFGKPEEPDPIWMRNLVITGNVINSAVNASIPLFHITSTEGAVIANNVINNNGCPGPSAILVDNKTVTGLKCRNNVAQISGVEVLACIPPGCCY